MKKIKIYLDNVFSRQLEELCDSLGMTVGQYCQLAVMEQTIAVKEKINALTKQLKENASTSEAKEEV